MADSQYSAQTRVQVLLEFLHEREMDLEDLAEMKRVKLEQCVQLCQFQNDANQVRIGISDCTSLKGILTESLRHSYKHVKFCWVWVLSAMTVQSMVFWVLKSVHFRESMPFSGTHCLHLQVQRVR